MKTIETYKNKSKILSLALAWIFIFTMIIPSLPAQATTTGNVEIAGLSPEEWYSMTDEQIDQYFATSRAVGNSGIGINVGGWTGAGGTSTNTIKIPPITIDGNIAYCARALRDFPVNTTYSSSYVNSDVKLRALLYHGYPNNASGLQQQYGLTDVQARQYTQFAVWKLLGFVGPGLAYADRIHPYSEALLAKANSGDLNGYNNPVLNLSSKVVTGIQKGGYQETEAINTSGTSGTFTFPSTSEIWSVDINGNKKNTFNVGESFKIRSTGSLTTVKNITITGSFKNPQAVIYNAPGNYQDLTTFQWGPNNNVSQSLSVTFNGTGNVSIHKVNDRGDNLQGVKFGLYSDAAANNIISESVTDTNGNIIFADINPGTYYIKEISTVEGHMLSTEIKRVVVTAGATHTFEWVNNSIKSIIKFFKYDTKTQQPMANVNFSIKALSGLDAGKTFDVTTDETGYFTTELAYGNYQIVEVKTLEGYILNTTPINFTVTENGQEISLSMSNDRINGNVRFLKYDEDTKAPMPNVKFKIEGLGGFNKGEIFEVTTGDDGYFNTTLEFGEYQITEVETLDGYILNTTPINFIINENGQQIELSMSNKRVKSNVKFLKLDTETNEPMANVKFIVTALSGLDNGQNWEFVTDETGYFTTELSYGKYQIIEVKTNEGYILNNEPIEFEVTEDGQEISLQMTNDRIKGSVELLKIDSENNKPLAGVTFEIESLDAFQQGKVWSIISDENGIAKMENLQYGKYQIKEVKTVDGYILNETPIPFEIRNDGEVIKLEMANDRISGSAELLKVDAETKEPLENVIFELECLEGFNQGSNIQFTSDLNGIVQMSNLQYGKYRLIEIKTIEGYVLDSNPIEFEIKNDGETIDLIMENREIKGRIDIVKYDGNSSKKLQGAEFGIYDKDKNLIEVIVTDENGVATSSELTYGKYYYRELKAPNGYVVDGNFYNFSIEEDNIAKIVKFKNYPVITYNKPIEPQKWNKTYDSTVPNTGDSMNIGMSLLALLASAGSIAIIKRKRK